MPFVREEVFCVLLNGMKLSTVLCFVDRSGIGRAQIWEETAESLLSTLCQWHRDLSGGCKGRERILNILNFQLIHSCWGAGVWGGRVQHCPLCALCSAVLSVVQHRWGASVRRLLQLQGEMLGCSPGGQGYWACISTEPGALADFHSPRSSNYFFSRVQRLWDTAKLWIFSSTNVGDT